MSDIVLASSDVPVQFERQMHMAQVLAESSLLPTQLRGRPANVLVILQGARALNVPAFWALQSMHVIEGKLSMSAELMRALVIRAGHRFRIVERTAARAVVEIHRRDRDEPYRFEFTADDARTAELFGKGNWKKYPKAMLLARATSGAVRDECPDVLFGVVYTPDELGVVTDDDGNPDYVEGKIIQVPSPDKVEELAASLGAVELEQFPAAWQAVVDFGWALEKVPGSDDLCLAEVAAEVLRDVAKEAESTDRVKTIWRIGKACDLMSVGVRPVGMFSTDEPVVRLGDYLKARGEHVASIERARADAGITPPEAEVVEAEVVEPATTAEDIDTENAERLRQAAEASWAADEEGRPVDA